jgi:hypothetical protein
MLISNLGSTPSIPKKSGQPRAGRPGDIVGAPCEEAPAFAQLHKLRYPGETLASRLEGLFARAEHSPNPVVASLRSTIENAKYVSMDLDAIRKSARELTPAQLQPADWRFPHYIDEDSPKTIDFFMLSNSINFLFFDPKSGEKFKTEFEGKEYTGSEGMIACIKRAMKEGVPILDAAFLAQVKPEEMAHIFRGNIELPLLQERTDIFHEVGQTLLEKYDGSFANLARGGKAFDGGDGIVEKLTRDFPSFRDGAAGEPVFNKRAQLAVGMLHSRLAGTGVFSCPDVAELTVFADYQLPRGLRNMGVLEYGPELAERVDNSRPIERDSQMEKEIRAFTIVASELLREELTKRPELGNLDARGLDSYLWAMARTDKNSKPHVTVTTAY